MVKYYCALCEIEHFTRRVENDQSCPVCENIYCRESMQNALEEGNDLCPACETPFDAFDLYSGPSTCGGPCPSFLPILMVIFVLGGVVILTLKQAWSFEPGTIHISNRKNDKE